MGVAMRNTDGFAGLESLEQRTLLTTVYDFDPYTADQVGLENTLYGSAGSIYVDEFGDLIARDGYEWGGGSDLFRLESNSWRSFGSEFVPNGDFIGSFETYFGFGSLLASNYADKSSSPPAGVISITNSGTVRQAWVPDASSPGAELDAWGSVPNGSFRIVIEYHDSFRLDDSTLREIHPELTSPSGSTIALTSRRIDSNSSDWAIESKVRYAYELEPPGGSWDKSDNGAYTFTIEAGAIADAVGNTFDQEFTRTFLIDCPDNGLDWTGQPWKPLPFTEPGPLEPLPLNSWRSDYKGFRGTTLFGSAVSDGDSYGGVSVLLQASDGSGYQIAELSTTGEPVYRPVELPGTIMKAWGSSSGGFIVATNSPASPYAPTQLVHVDRGGAVRIIIDESDFISWNDGAFASSGESVPSVSLDGSVVVWYGIPTAKGASRASTHRASGFFAAVQSGGDWSLMRVGGDRANGYIEAGESFTDLNRNRKFDEGVEVATVYGASFEDIGPLGLGYRVHVSNSARTGGAFKVLFSQSDSPELWVVDVVPDSASSGGYSVSAPDLILQQKWSADGDTGSSGATNFWWSNEPITSIHLWDRSINAEGVIAFMAFTESGSRLVVRANPAGLRPVLYVPGIMGSFPVRDQTLAWLLQRGAPPQWMEIDPLANGYADILRSLTNVGYTPGVDLISAVYDWRMPPGPAPIREGGIGSIDGYVDGITAASISDGVFEYGVDYLGYWLKRAASTWALIHPGVPLDSVDIIAHSTGGLVARTYIQSLAYLGAEQAGLPRINELVMIGVPNRGASKAWNVLHDNWIGDISYMAVFSTIMEVAREKMISIGQIFGPGGTSITPAMVAAHAQRLDPSNPNEYEAFIDLYCPTIRSLLATYPMLDIDRDGVPELAVGRAGTAYPLDVPNPILERNEWVLDLNNGLDLNYTSWTFMDLLTDPVRDPNRFGGHRAGGYTGATVIYGESSVTLSYAAMRLGALDSGVALESDEFWPWQVFRMTDEVSGYAGLTERWYRDKSHDVGDLTVPRQSSRDQFLGDPRFRVRGFTSNVASTSGPGTTAVTAGRTDHVGLNSNADVQRLVLETLGIAPLSSQISTILAAVDAWNVGSTLSGMLIISLIVDPVQGYVVDGLGRRLGWTEATGVLTEIPGSIYRGEADGFGFVTGEVVQPLRFVTIGLGGEHFSKVRMARGSQMVAAESHGFLAAGQQRVQGITPPAPVNTHEADRVMRALLSAVPSVSVGPGGTLTIGVINEYGQTTLFQRGASNGGWSAREPDPLGTAGTPSSDSITWRDPKDGKFYAAVPTDRGLLLFRETDAGTWTVRNLTQEITGAALINSKITQWKTNATRNNVHRIVGVMENGDVVQYEQTVAQGSNGYLWNFKNLSDDLRAIGEATPRFDGRLVAYTTAWDAWHIAGLDADGQIQTIWRGPKMGQWVLSNLSTITGAPVLSGGLTVYLTPWKGINLAGVDQSGQLQVTWWVPKFIGAWVVSNLSSSISAPAIDGASIVSFNTPAGGLNMAARTAANELVVFWWVPGAPGNKWRVQDVSSAVPTSTSSVVPEGELAAAASGDGLTSIVGRTASGEVVRFHGSVIDQTWNVDVLGDIAIYRK